MSTDVHSLVGAYVLDALGDGERAAFDRHLSGCVTCRAEADELFGVTVRLPVETTLAEPRHTTGARRTRLLIAAAAVITIVLVVIIIAVYRMWTVT